MFLRFHDVIPVAFKKPEKFLFLFCENLKVIEGIGSVPEAGLPFGDGDGKAAMSRLHVAAKVLAWSARKFAHLTDQKLAPTPG